MKKKSEKDNSLKIPGSELLKDIENSKSFIAELKVQEPRLKSVGLSIDDAVAFIVRKIGIASAKHIDDLVNDYSYEQLQKGESKESILRGVDEILKDVDTWELQNEFKTREAVRASVQELIDMRQAK